MRSPPSCTPNMRPRSLNCGRSRRGVYASRFSEQELKDALTFYRTPLGKKLIEQEPKILDQTMTDAQAWGDKLSQEVMNRMRAEMKKRGHEL